MRFEKFTQKRICVATSGGADSMALLHFLKKSEEKFGYLLFAVHCEHGIRGEESVADWKFVEQTCLEWGIPVFFFSEDCKRKAKEEKTSLETAARNFRYQSFETLIKSGKVDYIATAHHADDEAETILFRLARGASISGAKGMQEENDWLLRPILSWTKQDVMKYVAENAIEYRTDKTNFEQDATRNALRLSILPKLEERIPGAANALVRFARLAAEDDALLYEYAQALLRFDGKTAEIAFSDKKPLFCRACLLAMKALGVEKDYTAAHLESVFFLQDSERGAMLNLPQNVIAKRNVDTISLFIKKEEAFVKNEPKVFTLKGFDGGRYEITLSFDKNVAQGSGKSLYVDADKIPQNAVFRFREEGDVIQRFGGGKKSLKKIFNEEKIPVEEREYLPLIAQEKEVLVVCGVEISEKVKVDENTKRILYIQTTKKE